MNTKQITLMCKALSDENRVKIICMLKNSEKCACRLLEPFEMTQPTLSHHMKVLCDCGLVNGRKEGKWTHYSISKDGLSVLQNFLDVLMKEDNADE